MALACQAVFVAVMVILAMSPDSCPAATFCDLFTQDSVLPVRVNTGKQRRNDWQIWWLVATTAQWLVLVLWLRK